MPHEENDDNVEDGEKDKPQRIAKGEKVELINNERSKRYEGNGIGP